MKKTVVFCLLVILLAVGFTGCDNGNGNGNGENQSPYAGTWQSTVYQARIIIEGNTTLTATLQFRSTAASPWGNAAKGSLVIAGTNVTMTYTHVWKNEAWSDNPADITEAAPAIGDNPMAGTVTGSNVGSTIFDNFVKQ